MNKRAFACCVFLSVTFFLSTAMLVLSACGAAGKAEEGWVGDRELASLPEPAESLAVMPETAAEFNTEEYDRIYENEFLEALSNPLSTVSIDVDTASYSNVRRFINDSQLPPQDAVRIEELINYFSYDYPQPEGEHPFSVYTEVSEAPWNLDHRLVHIGLQGLDVPKEELPNSNLVFLLDVSGSMNDPNKLPLVKSGFKLLTEQLGERDRVAIVVYAGAAGQVLPSTNGENKAAILDALEMLEAGGSTAGGQGIELAYRIAAENFIEGGNNRVILATDGDFNVGPSSDAALIRLIEEKREQGIFLSVLGFGSGNLKDSKMEQLADKGNGNYYYIDSIREAKKVLVSEMAGTLLTIAKDVKIQIEFNPTKVKAYRLIGYENRLLAKEDFADDTKDAGELGAGTAVTFLYEIIPAGADEAVRATPELKYQDTEVSDEAVLSNELLTVSLRYKLPDGDESTLITQPVLDESIPLDQTSDNFRFAAAVAEFGMLLRDSAFKGDATYQDVGELAQGSLGNDEAGFRFEFLKMVETAELLD
jgi:Ca-activated chloride channel family protein